MLAIGTGELLAWGEELYDEPFDDNWYGGSWIDAEIDTVTEWTKNLPQIKWVFMTYGHDNSDGIDLGFDPDSVSTQETLLGRNDEGLWENRNACAQSYGESFPDGHPAPSMF